MNPQTLINEMIDGSKGGSDQQKSEEQNIIDNDHWLQDSVTDKKIKELIRVTNNLSKNVQGQAIDPTVSDASVRVSAIKFAVASAFLQTLINPTN